MREEACNTIVDEHPSSYRAATISQGDDPPSIHCLLLLRPPHQCGARHAPVDKNAAAALSLRPGAWTAQGGVAGLVPAGRGGASWGNGTAQGAAVARGAFWGGGHDGAQEGVAAHSNVEGSCTRFPDVAGCARCALRVGRSADKHPWVLWLNGGGIRGG